MPYSLGNSLESTGHRLYKRFEKNGKMSSVLISWTNKRCKQCGRFTRSNRNICKNCYLKNKREYIKEYCKTKYDNDMDYRKRKLSYYRQYYKEGRRRS